jgi:hypothetical protein
MLANERRAFNGLVAFKQSGGRVWVQGLRFESA